MEGARYCTERVDDLIGDETGGAASALQIFDLSRSASDRVIWGRRMRTQSFTTTDPWLSYLKSVALLSCYSLPYNCAAPCELYTAELQAPPPS